MARPKYTEENYQDIKSKLIDVAMKICQEHGENALSLRKIALAGGISHTYVYRYFADKEELLVEVRLRCVKELHAYILQNDDSSASPVDRIKRVLNCIHEHALQSPHSFNVMYTMEQPTSRKYPALKQEREKLFAFAVELSKLAKEQGAIQLEPLEFTHLAWSTFHGMITLDATHNLNLGKTIDELKASVWKMFFPTLENA